MSKSFVYKIAEMRAFYEDESEKRVFYVKIDNITISHENNAYKIIKADNGSELLSEVIKVFGFSDKFKQNIQIWTNTVANGKGVRLDIMNDIPKEYEFVYVRGISNNNHNDM